MQREVLEGVDAGRPFQQQAVVRNARPFLPALSERLGSPVKQDDGPLRGFGPQRRAAALDLLEAEVFDQLLDAGRVLLRDLAFAAVPPCAGESAAMDDDAKRIIPQRDNLHPQRIAGVFPLDGEIRIGRGPLRRVIHRIRILSAPPDAQSNGQQPAHPDNSNPHRHSPGNRFLEQRALGLINGLAMRTVVTASFSLRDFASQRLCVGLTAARPRCCGIAPGCHGPADRPAPAPPTRCPAVPPVWA